MAEKGMTLEERMTPSERELYELWRGRIGETWVPGSVQETLYNKGWVNFSGFNKEACWTLVTRWAIATEDFNPLWFDEEYARKSKWGGIIAPPSYLIAIDDGLEFSSLLVEELMFTPPTWVPSEPCPWNTHKYPNFVRTVTTGFEFEFFEPVRPGDIIDTTVKLADVYWKQGKQQRLLFMEDEVTYTNQKGQLVAKGRGGWVLVFK